MESMVLAWLSDHNPTERQRQSLEDRGYEIVLVPSPKPERWTSSTSAVLATLRRCGGIPDAVMLVLPEVMGGGFMLEMNRHARQFNKTVTYLQAEMRYNGDESDWNGRWIELKGVEYVREVWKKRNSNPVQ